jgi:adhesin transport system outer membrane protein
MTGHLPEDPMERPAFKWSAYLTDIDSVVQHALNNHPQLDSAEFESRAVSYDVDVEKARLFPDVNGELSYLKRDQDDVIGGESIDAKAVVRLNWNFSTGGAEIYRVKKKKRRYQEQLAQEQELKRIIEKEARASWHEYETSRSALSLSKKRLDLNNELFTTNEKQFEAARINILQLMQADNARFNVKMSVLNSEYRHLASQYSLLANSGRLQEALGVVQANIDEK